MIYGNKNKLSCPDMKTMIFTLIQMKINVQLDNV
jgi:hypothetical protein